MKGKKQESISRRRKEMWRRYVSLLVAMVLVMGNVMPAISEGLDPICGKAEHTHGKECYTQVKEVICGSEETEGHVHSAECLGTKQNLICQTEASVGHQHDNTCYTPTPKLNCGLEDNAGHQHNENCPTITNSTLVCTLTENAGHVHEESCYEVTEQLICTSTEEGHEHAEECYAMVRTENLICGKEAGADAHSHDANACYITETVVNCEIPVGEGAHTHTDTCYINEDILTCTKAVGEGAHEHSEGCYETVNEYICGKAPNEGAHKHEDACYAVKEVLECTEEEHTHNGTCYPNEETEVQPANEVPEANEEAAETNKTEETEALRTGEAVYMGKYIENVTLESRQIGTDVWNLLADKVTEKAEGLSADETDELKITVEFKIPGGTLIGTTAVDYKLPLKSNEAVYQNKEEIVYALDKVTAIGKAVTATDGIVTITFDEEYLKANDNGTELNGTYAFVANAGELSYDEENKAEVRFLENEIVSQDESLNIVAVALNFEKEVPETDAPTSESDVEETDAEESESNVEETDAEESESDVDETDAEESESNVKETDAEESDVDETDADETDAEVIENVVTFQSDEGANVLVDGVDVTNATAMAKNGTIYFEVQVAEGYELVSVIVDNNIDARFSDRKPGEYIIENIQTDATIVAVTTRIPESELQQPEEKPITNKVTFRISEGAKVLVKDTDVAITENIAMAENGTICFAVEIEEGYELVQVLMDNEKELVPDETTGLYRIGNIKTDETVVDITTVPMLKTLSNIGEIAVTYAEGAVEKGAQLKVKDEIPNLENINQAINEKLAEKFEETAALRPFDINLTDNKGKAAEVTGEVTVNVTLAEPVSKEEAEEIGVEVYQVTDAGDAEEVTDITYNEEVNGSETTITGFSFTTEEPAPYVFVEKETITTQVITADGESYTIEVSYGPEAGIPANAVLEATEILAGSEEYEHYMEQSRKMFAGNEETSQNTEEKLESELTFARFFDIHIVADGTEYEPLVPVQVSIRYDDAVPMEKNEQMKVIHFASTGTEIIDVEVKENEDGITDITYMQSSFSVSGTVVQYLSSGWPTSNGNYVIVVKPYNSNNYYAIKNDGELTSVNYNSTTGKVTFSDLTSVSQVDNYWWTISSSQYGSGRYVKAGSNYLDPNRESGLNTESVAIYRTSNGAIRNWNYGSDNYLLVNESSLKIAGLGSSSSNNRAVVFLANDFEVDEVEEPVEGPEEYDLGAPQANKAITSNDDGTYQLALSVTGKSQAQEIHSKADILVILDTSGSMSSDRMSSAVTALRSLASTLFENNTTAYPDTVRMKLMTFSTLTRWKNNNGYYSDFAWATGVNGYSTFNGHLSQLSSSGNGGTNWEDALQDALNVEMRSDAEKYVIFVSDGNPTFRNTQGNTSWVDNDYYRTYGVWGGGQETATTVSRCYQMARDDAKALVDSGYSFYTIGVFGNVDRMKNLTAYAYSGSDSGTYPAGHYQTASDTSSLNAAFATIIDDIQKNFSYTDVTIDDGITALTAAALVSGTVNNYQYKITYVDAADNQKHTVSVTKNADGTVSIPAVTYNVKKSDGTTNSVTTTAVTVKGASYDGSKVTWELDKSDGSNYKLENGWTYEVSFTVWPTQRAYDLVADLANGVTTYDSLTDAEKASIDQATLTLKTNSEASVSYRQITTTNGVDGTPSDLQNVAIENPPGIPLLGSNLKIVKRWNDDLDPSQLLDLLTNNLNDAGTDVNYTVTLDVVQDKGTAAEEAVHTADYPNGFVFKPNVTIVDGEVTAATWPEIDIAVAPGVMVSAEIARKYGFDTAVDGNGNPKYSTLTFEGVTYYVLEKGHRYQITERAVDYHFEMLSDIDHLMIIDGVLKNVIFNEAGTQIVEISENPGNLTELGATNSLKGGINLYKYVEDSEGNRITPKDDVFTVKCRIVDKNGNAYIRTSETVGNNESDGIVYRVYAPDEELETVYGGKVDTGRNRTIKIGVLNSSEFTVQLKAGWQIRFINVPSGAQWTFEEVNIPGGYAIDLTGTEIVNGVSAAKTRGMTGTAMVNTAHDCQIVNKKSDYNVEILKVEKGTDNVDANGNYTDSLVVLADVSFVLKNSEGNYYVSNTNGNITWGEKNMAHSFKTGSDGKVNLGALPAGTYYLIETATRPGYNLLAEAVTVVISVDGVTFKTSASEALKNAKETVSGNTVTCTVVVANSIGYRLPNTGGTGTTTYTIGGLLMILSSGIFLMYNNKKRRKEGVLSN